MNKFFKGAFLLIFVAFIGECFEFLINMILARSLGERGMGLYMSILPTLFLVIILASLELPVSISKYIAEKSKEYHRNILHHAIRLAVMLAAILFVIAVVTLPFLSLFEDYHPYVRYLVLALIPITAFSSIARGYFMGLQRMGIIAVSYFLRKAGQFLLLVLLYRFFEFDGETALFIALCTLVASELVVCIYLLHNYFIQIRTMESVVSKSIPGKEARKHLLSVSVPTTGLRVFHAVTHAVQPFLIKKALLVSGLDMTIATEQFGLLAGVVLTIGFFPAFIAHSLLIVLIPRVSELYAKHDLHKLHRLLKQVMTMTACYGIPSVLVFYFFAKPLTNLFFDSTFAAIYLKMLWLYFLLHFFVIPMQAFLIGIGLAKDAFLHSVWSTVVSFALLYGLGSLETLRMEGVIIGMNTGIVLLTLLHVALISKKLHLSVFIRSDYRRR